LKRHSSGTSKSDAKCATAQEQILILRWEEDAKNAKEKAGACSQMVQLKVARLVQAEAKITDFLAGVRYVKNATVSAKLSCFNSKKAFS
jgi:hypothetical protein